MLHGGPGACHDYLESLQPFAATGRPVIFTTTSCAEIRIGQTTH